MSNYINVLRRLERERRTPESAPVVSAPLMPVPVMPAETSVRTAPAPAVVPAPPPVAEVVPSTLPRTVIPLPTTMPPPAAPAPIVPTPIATPPVAVPAIAPAPAERIGTPIVPEVPVPPADLVDTRRARAFAPHAHPGIATLLDNIRMLSGPRAGRIVVLCGASTAEPVGPLAAQLAAHAEARGMRAIVGTLLRTPTGSIITPAGVSNDEAVSVRIDLDGGPSADHLHAWAQRVAPAYDLVVLTGPPLASSIDAALLACACDGLAIVAESEVTDRAALQTAAERARIAGCRTLGVVMHGTKDRMPGWIRRIMGDRSETHSRED